MVDKLDNYDIKILRLLNENARMTIKEISEKIHLSQPTSAERVKKLEAKGIIQQYTTVMNWQELGYPLATIIRIRPLPGFLNQVEMIIKEMDNVTWCYKVTGDDAFVCQMMIESVVQLDDYLSKISQIAMTSTSIIKSTIVENRFVEANTD